jgi:hypothetical protein
MIIPTAMPFCPAARLGLGQTNLEGLVNKTRIAVQQGQQDPRKGRVCRPHALEAGTEQLSDLFAGFALPGRSTALRRRGLNGGRDGLL